MKKESVYQKFLGNVSPGEVWKMLRNHRIIEVKKNG